MTGTWSEPMTERMKALWNEGYSASQVARVINAEFATGISCNSVLSKVHRSGMPLRGLKGNTRHSQQERTPRTRPAMGVEHAQLPEPEPEEAEPSPDAEPILLLDAGSFHCRWMLGDPGAGDMRICGKMKREGSPYCEAHSRKAYVPVRKRSERDDEDVRRAKAALKNTGITRLFG